MTEAAEPEVYPEPTPVLRANGLGLRGRHGWVFRDLNLTVPTGAVAAVRGRAGSGRSMALLALSARAVATEGTLMVDGATERSAIRGRVAVARIFGAVQLEPHLRVRDHVRERTLLGATGNVDWPATALGLALRPDAVVADLSALDALLCAVALAVMDRPAVVVVDDVDLGLDDAERTVAWQRLHRLADHGPAIVASAVEAPHTGAIVVDLQGES